MPTRRRALQATGTVALGLLAGCLGGSSERTGYAPDAVVPQDPPPAPDVDPTTFETLSVDGTPVPLVPIDVAYAWYLRQEGRFADARGVGQYERAHVAGAVSSPAPDGGSDDPVNDWPQGDRVVTYCGCPHHLSTMRAAPLIDAGYERVYAIDEGFIPWYERGYPVRGSTVEGSAAGGQAALAPVTVHGRTDPADAGETAWAVHAASDQREATAIGADGGYELHLYFGNLPSDASITVRTPSYAVTAPLETVRSRTVTAALA